MGWDPWAGYIVTILSFDDLLFTCMIVCHLLCVGLKCIDCRFLWNPFFVIMACGYKPPPPSAGAKYGWKAGKASARTLIDAMKEIAKAAKFIAVAGTIGFAFVGDWSPVCHTNRDLVVIVKTRTCRAFGEDSIPPRF